MLAFEYRFSWSVTDKEQRTPQAIRVGYQAKETRHTQRLKFSRAPDSN